MLARARTRCLAARTAMCAAGMALAAAPSAALADPGVAVPPLPQPPLPAGVPPVPPVAAPLSAPGAVSHRCRGARARAGRASRSKMRRALLCLINRERARNGRQPLAADGRLARAAGRHAADMARRGYFGHVSPSGVSPERRARAAGWNGGVVEAIAWGCGALSTPRATLRVWMNSPPHRAIVLGGARRAGIGFRGARGCGGRGYWVADVG